ncbi:MAG: phenylacetate-CoA oxygenase subunit PaaC [Rhodobacteraceae bacterium]|nr:phenylacetate-CoA oxygenase subunit PaaC [Paracoccaceae bacterium]
MGCAAFARALLELADDHLILGHRLSECCGHAPILEEDLAMPNLALDLIGRARELYSRAGEVEGLGRSEDEFAYLRSEREFLNCLLVERPNRDFAHIMLRQFYFSNFMELYWLRAADSRDATVRGAAAKSVNEMKYHIRHSGEWIVRLGDGTGESARRAAEAVGELQFYIDELFIPSASAEICFETGLLPDRRSMREEWDQRVERVFTMAKLDFPEPVPALTGGRTGRHDECLGHLLAEMQHLQRVYPGAEW